MNNKGPNNMNNNGPNRFEQFMIGTGVTTWVLILIAIVVDFVKWVWERS